MLVNAPSLIVQSEEGPGVQLLKMTSIKTLRGHFLKHQVTPAPGIIVVKIVVWLHYSRKWIFAINLLEVRVIVTFRNFQ